VRIYRDLTDSGVRGDLLDLAKLPYVKGFTARVFWEGGLKSIGAIAESDVDELVPLLIQGNLLILIAHEGPFFFEA
jgi:hypothetical protein